MFVNSQICKSARTRAFTPFLSGSDSEVDQAEGSAAHPNRGFSPLIAKFLLANAEYCDIILLILRNAFDFWQVFCYEHKQK